MGAKRLGLKIEAKRLGGKRLGGKRLGCETSCYRCFDLVKLPTHKFYIVNYIRRGLIDERRETILEEIQNHREIIRLFVTH